jgi:hypothetical protein
MGLINSILGLGRSAESIGGAVEQVAEIFVPNKTKKMQQQHREFTAALDQFEAEFKQKPRGPFDRFVNALNRLPRPVLALGTVGLFVYAMVDPAGFTTRMQGLAFVPDPLWWLLGAVVSFYFGARELHYFRGGRAAMQAHSNAAGPLQQTSFSSQPLGLVARQSGPDGNAALDDWRSQTAK